MNNRAFDEMIDGQCDAWLDWVEDRIKEQHPSVSGIWADRSSYVGITNADYLEARNYFKEAIKARLRLPRWLDM